MISAYVIVVIGLAAILLGAGAVLRRDFLFATLFVMMFAALIFAVMVPSFQ